MSERKYYAQKTLTLEAELIQMKSAQLGLPSSYTQFNSTGPQTFVAGAAAADVGPYTAAVLKNDEWTINPANHSQFIRGYPLQGPLSFSFDLQMIIAAYAATACHFVINATLTRGGVDTLLYGFDVIADSTGLGNSYIQGKSWAFNYEFLYGDMIRFRAQATTTNAVINSIIVEMKQ